MYRALSLAIAISGAAFAANAQAVPSAYDSAVVYLRQGDTAEAVAALRVATRKAPSFGPAFLRLGSVLVATASEIPSDYNQRVEADHALRRAQELLGDDPEVLVESGILLEKQQARTDARRVLDRAGRAAQRRGDSLPPSLRAQLYYALAKIYQSWWEDWDHLVQLPRGAMPGCPRIDPVTGTWIQATAKEAIACPALWIRSLSNAVPLSDLKGDERERMLSHLRLAFEADSSLTDAAVRLLGHLAEAKAWSTYDTVARRLEHVAPRDYRSYLFRALGFHERGLDAPADSEFARALAIMPDDDRRVFANVAPLLPRGVRAHYLALDSTARAHTDRTFYAIVNPLYLTGVNERELEHYARLAWADLQFGTPEAGLRGWDTDRGRIWVRYGEPSSVVMCCYGAAETGLDARYVFWAYGKYGPVFVFTKRSRTSK